MGGAQRNARKRKQQANQATKALSAARGSSNDRRNVIIGVVVVVVLAVAVIGGVLYTNKQAAKNADSIPVSNAHAQYETKFDPKGVVQAGNQSAKTTVDIYEDFLCPGCGGFEKLYGEQIEKALADGKIKVNYHTIAILDNQSRPAGYSTLAANAALCAASTDKFPDFHSTLFAQQPKEGAKGYTNEQLVKLGQDLGISGGDFESCVRDEKNKDLVKKHTDEVTNDKSLEREANGRRGFFTPTVQVNGKLVDPSKEQDWLNKALQEAGS
ncbi:membrane protein [Longimycelium tulufanense]|uniref:Membrane protein n=1 Tax=Longimycelium tulufanense TaxID=907463 RepID=A0A8J3FV73_9PSEU|nr:thioredoxin domain-containing protein [Longimycelium tulufanense]GGM41772.1 membrane protein [Longimycelium tulufanense]